ncbi:MAG: sporulation transcriptional regulator SpoIIID [Clostridia bacterium]|nr:sporulation transcriptional regulator SpoIIID [Clostridia bacterium]
MKENTSVQKLSLNQERCEELAAYLIENRSTIRDTAARFGISKSTVHKDVTQKLQNSNPLMYESVKEILEVNKAERHLRGGEATRIKYLKINDRYK